MSSTFLVRLRVGEILMDAKGVSRVYATDPRATRSCWWPPRSSRSRVVGLAAAPAVRLAARRTVPPVAVRPERTPVISFRYHIVTIVAVFLALAIGLLGGAAFVQPALQEQLQDQTDRLRNDLEDRTQQIGDLRDQLGALNGFADSVMPYLTSGTPSEDPVILVTQAGVEEEVLAGPGGVGERGRAHLDDRVGHRPARVGGPDHPGSAGDDRGGAHRAGGGTPELAAEALAQGLSPSTTVIGGEVVTTCVRGVPGTDRPVQASQATLEEIGAPGQVVVVLSGGRGGADAPPRRSRSRSSNGWPDWASPWRRGSRC